MTRPAPDWISRVLAMRVGEAIVIDTRLKMDSVRRNLRQLSGGYKCKTIAPERTYRIERVT